MDALLATVAYVRGRSTAQLALRRAVATGPPSREYRVRINDILTKGRSGIHRDVQTPAP